jgi:hypothetical protein
MENTSIPKIFSGAKEYRDLPDVLELAQATFNEEGIYKKIAEVAADHFKNYSKPIKIIDLCAATGLTAKRVCEKISLSLITLVDLDCFALEKARQYFSPQSNIVTHCTDAVNFRDNNFYDLVLLNSAYHHIEGNKKVEFLKTVKNLITDSGLVIIGEQFLPSYKNSTEFQSAVEIFYDVLIKELEGRNENPTAIDVIRRSGLYTWENNYEYKVSWEVFKDDVKSTEFKIDRIIPVWQPNFTVNSLVGSYVVTLSK